MKTKITKKEAEHFTKNNHQGEHHAIKIKIVSEVELDIKKFTFCAECHVTLNIETLPHEYIKTNEMVVYL
jgi:hypothetical protein